MTHVRVSDRLPSFQQILSVQELISTVPQYSIQTVIHFGRDLINFHSNSDDGKWFRYLCIPILILIRAVQIPISVSGFSKVYDSLFWFKLYMNLIPGFTQHHEFHSRSLWFRLWSQSQYFYPKIQIRFQLHWLWL